MLVTFPPPSSHRQQPTRIEIPRERLADVDDGDTCSWCARETAPSRCTRCHFVTYCSKACQKADWPRHRAQCPYAARWHVVSYDAALTYVVMVMERLAREIGVRGHYVVEFDAGPTETYVLSFVDHARAETSQDELAWRAEVALVLVCFRDLARGSGRQPIVQLPIYPAEMLRRTDYRSNIEREHDRAVLRGEEVVMYVLGAPPRAQIYLRRRPTRPPRFFRVCALPHPRKRCACRGPFYCDSVCQAIDWPLHAKTCTWKDSQPS